MRKEQRMRVFENRVLRKILEARRIEVTGGGDFEMRSCVMPA